MKALAICVIGMPTPLWSDLSLVIDKLLTASTTGTSSDAAHDVHTPLSDSAQVFAAVLRQAQHFLAGQGGLGEMQVFAFDSLTAFRAAIQKPQHPLRSGKLSLEMFFVDVSALGPGVADPGWATQIRQHLSDACEDHSVPVRRSPHSFTFYLHRDDPRGCAVHGHGAVHARMMTGDTSARRADVLRIVLDHLDHAHFNRMLARSVDAAFRPTAMASAITRVMTARWPGRWDFYAFTGSVVAAFIDSMAALGQDTGSRQLTGPNEHALACGALAGWQLHGRAYVIAVTSGMVDEFKGTLSNLMRARASGLIVCADSPSNSWFAFQGTVNQNGDGRHIMQARGLPHVYIETAEGIAPALEQAFEALQQNAGPVVVFATPAVLESCAPLGDLFAITSEPLHDTPVDHPEDGFAEALRIVNHHDAHLLWQCGRLTNAERAMVYDIAERAGIALADSLAHPGSVSSHHGGRVVGNYLGTLGLYAFSRRVHQFLHTGDELNPKDGQSVFFVKSKADQLSTPFSEGKLSRSLHLVQVNRDPLAFAPFADVKVCLSATRFLERLRAQLNVHPHVLDKRRRKIAALRALPEAVPVDLIETLPMSANYLFHRLAGLVQQLIETEGYRYTGVFDVGRGGVSAVRNMPRTDPGFSGWYGRALMGDALMALPYVALNAPSHVLAFVGDGARAVVPDVEAQLLQMQSQRDEARHQNVTLFYLTNGVLSMIQSYLDFRFARHGGPQVTVPGRAARDSVETRGGLSVHRQTLDRFDAPALREALTTPGRINFFDVRLTHNSSGDGMSLASEASWSRTTPMQESNP